mgnify:CR=1 FL=1
MDAPEQLSEQEVLGVLTTLAQHDPRRALEYVMNSSSVADRNRSLIQVLQSASAVDPDLALDYLGQLDDSAETQQLYQRMSMTMAERDRPRFSLRCLAVDYQCWLAISSDKNERY